MHHSLAIYPSRNYMRMREIRLWNDLGSSGGPHLIVSTCNSLSNGCTFFIEPHEVPNYENPIASRKVKPQFHEKSRT